MSETDDDLTEPQKDLLVAVYDLSLRKKLDVAELMTVMTPGWRGAGVLSELMEDVREGRPTLKARGLAGITDFRWAFIQPAGQALAVAIKQSRASQKEPRTK